MSSEIKGIVIKGIGGFYYVMSGGRIYECKAGGRLRLGDTSPVAGDNVMVELTGEEGLITTVCPRKNLLVRPPVANIDRLFVLASAAAPKTDPLLIDKVTVIALWQGIEPIILLNKADLDPSRELADVYKKAGFRVISTSAETGEGLAEVAALAQQGISCFTGNSGIGKSSIMTRLLPKIDLEVGTISDRISRGKHTTRQSELFAFGDGYLIDTPGFSSFDMTRMERILPLQLQHYFPEIDALFGQCRFSGCLHLKEPGCAVREEVEKGILASSRYESYTKIYQELLRVKDWEVK